MMRCMQVTSIYLDPEQASVLDRRAAAEGCTRSALIRELLDRALSADDDLDGDLLAIEDSFGALRDDETAVRRRDDRVGHLARMWQVDT